MFSTDFVLYITPMETRERVKRIRESLDLTRDKLGRELYCTGQTIWRWETGQCEPLRCFRSRLDELEQRHGIRDEGHASA